MLKINKVIYLSLFLFSLALSGCTNTTKENNLLIYMCGSDLESERGYASSNINDLLSASLRTNDNIYLLTGGSSSWENEDISNDVNLFKVENHKLNLLENFGSINMGESSTLNKFIETVESISDPNSINSLVFWDHGAGSINGVCFDENFNNDSLSLLEIKDAIKDNNFNYICFDACLMGTYETCNLLKNNANTIIFSEDLEPGSGWNYKDVAENFSLDNFDDLILSSYQNKHSYLSSYTLSSIDLTKFDILENYFNELKNKISNDDSLIDDMLSNLSSLGDATFNGSSLNLYDFGSLLDNLGIDYDFNDVIKKVNGISRDYLSGISLYFPSNLNNIDNYFSLIDDESYKDFLISYFNKAPEIPLNFDELMYLNKNNKVEFSLTKDSINYFKESYYLLIDEGHNYFEDDLLFIGGDNDFSQYNNNFEINFKGDWIYLNDEILYCEYLERSDSYTIFYSPILVNGKMEELIFTFNTINKKADLIGYIDLDVISSRINLFNKGDIITPLYGSAINDYYLIGDDLTYNENNFTLSVKQLKNGVYKYYLVLEDVFENFYIGGEVTISLNNDNYKITNIDTTNIGMLEGIE